jgi:hypothetical protein
VDVLAGLTARDPPDHRGWPGAAAGGAVTCEPMVDTDSTIDAIADLTPSPAPG